MQAEYIEHITSEGEAWDGLAYYYYGDETLLGTLIAANPHLPISATLQSGKRLAVPILDLSKRITADKLPPWKR